MRVDVVLVVGLFLSGCAGPEASGNPEPEPSGAGAENGADSITGEGSVTRQPGINGPMSLDDCVSRGGTFFWPLNTAPGDPPAGWGPPAFHYTSVTTHLYYECHRLNGTGLERGPVRFLMEAHNKVPYNDCTAGDRAFQLVPFRMYAENADFATHVRENWGLEVMEVAFQRDATEVGEAVTESLHMTTPDGTQPILTMTYAFGQQTAYAGPEVDQFFWAHEGGIQSWTLEFQADSHRPSTPLAQGSFHAPTILAQEGLTEAPLATGFYTGISFVGEFKWMTLEECSQ